MKILGALGTGVFLIIVAVMLPLVFIELSDTLVVILESVAQAFMAAGIVAGQIANVR